MAKIGCELRFVENSVTCVKKQLEVIEGITPVVSIILDSVSDLEKEVAFLRQRLEEEDMILKD